MSSVVASTSVGASHVVSGGADANRRVDVDDDAMAPTAVLVTALPWMEKAPTEASSLDDPMRSVDATRENLMMEIEEYSKSSEQ